MIMKAKLTFVASEIRQVHQEKPTDWYKTVKSMSGMGRDTSNVQFLTTSETAGMITNLSVQYANHYVIQCV